MSLPTYQNINIKNSSLQDLTLILNPDMNMKHPVVINLKALDMDQQREFIGVIENFFTGQNLSFKFPYPIYFISDHEVSITKIPLVHDSQELPKFYSQKDGKMNVKESHLAAKNKLLQQEVKNSDSSSNSGHIESYGDSHRQIYELEVERKFYRSLISSLTKVKKNG